MEKLTTQDQLLLHSIVAVVRTYNNRYVAKQVRNLLDMHVGAIVVVVDESRDKGSTAERLHREQLGYPTNMLFMKDGF